MQEDLPNQSCSLFQNIKIDSSTDESNDLKKKREEYANEIRAKEREQLLNLKRKNNMSQPPQQPLTMTSTNISIDIQNQLKEQIEILSKRNFTIEEFPSIIQSINTEDLIQLHWGVTGLRKILSVENNPPIQRVIDANLVPKLIDLINRDITPQLTLEAAWALTNVASGNTQQTQTIIDKGGINMFVKLLSSQCPDIAEQALWAIGNIAGDCSQYRDLILRSGGVDPLIRIIKGSNNKNTIKHGTWALSNLCRGKPLPDFKYVRNATPILCQVIIQEADQEVLVDACWALSYLSDGESSRIQTVIDSGVVPTLIRILDHPFLSILIPALRILGNVVTGDDKQTTYILEQGILDKLAHLLCHEKKPVRREVNETHAKNIFEACWTISNITAGNAGQISTVLRDKRILDKLFKLMRQDSPEIKREVAKGECLIDIRHHGQFQMQLHTGTLRKLYTWCKMDYSNCSWRCLIQLTQKLLPSFSKPLQMCLKKVVDENFQKLGDNNLGQDNQFLTKLEALQGIAKIEKLQKHENREIYQKCYNILEKYYEPMIDF